MVLGLLPEIRVPVVIDADGLNILAEEPEVLKALRHPAVLTPHPGEFARLCGESTRNVVKHKLSLAPDFAQEYGVHLVLKGHRTLTATPEGRGFVNPTGNPGMATGGSGDVLSGMLGSMIMQDPEFLISVLAAVYLHGLSGDLAVERTGEKSLIAGNLITHLPAAVKAIVDRAANP